MSEVIDIEKIKQCRKLLMKIVRYSKLLAHQYDIFHNNKHLCDIGQFQNYAWEIRDSYKKLSENLGIKNLIGDELVSVISNTLDHQRKEST